jgi:hypothetical protein
MYEPACIAYQGDKIELRDGRFTWQRYTDERTVDKAGNVVDPFPGFPKTGSYRVAAGRLELVTDDNARLDDWFIVERAGQRYLLNAQQHKAFLEGGEPPKCALEFTATDS